MRSDAVACLNSILGYLCKSASSEVDFHLERNISLLILIQNENYKQTYRAASLAMTYCLLFSQTLVGFSITSIFQLTFTNMKVTGIIDRSKDDFTSKWPPAPAPIF